MEAWHQGRVFQYAVVFLGTGLVAVAVKALGDANESRLAGVVAMLPIKILATWLILGGVMGSRGIHDSTSGMLAGLVAIVCLSLILMLSVIAPAQGGTACLRNAKGTHIELGNGGDRPGLSHAASHSSRAIRSGGC